MSNQEVSIRRMAGKDLTKVVGIHLESFSGSRSSRLGRPFLHRMYRWYLQFQPALSWVALLEGNVVGFVTGTFGWGGGGQRFRYTFWQILLGFVFHPSLLFSKDMFEHWQNYLRGLRSKRARPPVQTNQSSMKAALDSIAVHPQARGKNVGMSLMRAFENAACELGATFLSLGVEYDNLKARRLYESCGWELVHMDQKHNSASYMKKV